MREAGRHDDVDVVEAANHGDTEKVNAVPFASLGFASPRMPAPLADEFDVDLDMEDEASDDGDEEGETQVDAQRSADALKQMRALEAAASERASQPGLPTDLSSSSQRGRGLPPGRPAITAVPVPPSPLSPSARRLAGEPAGVSTLKFPPTVMSAAIQSDLLPADNRPEHLFSSSRLQFGSFADSPTEASVSDVALTLPRSRGVGRRTGVLIAISTAVAVALVAGAWTATQPETIPPVATTGTLTARLTARVPKGTGPIPAAPPPTVGVVVATAPPAPSSPEPVLAAAAPTSVPAPAEGWPSPPTEETVPAPVATAPAQQAPAPATSGRSTVTSKRAAAKSAKQARLNRKAQAAANKRRLRAPSSAKAQSVSPTRPGVTRSPASTRGGRGDPDDTLPPTD